MYGEFDKTEKKAEPNPSYKYAWYKEYSGIAGQSKESINEEKLILIQF